MLKMPHSCGDPRVRGQLRGKILQVRDWQRASGVFNELAGLLCALLHEASVALMASSCLHTAHIAYARDIAAGSGANVSERSGLTTRLGTAHSRVGTAQSLKSTSAGGMQGSQSRAQTAMSASNDASALPDLPKVCQDT